MSLIPHKHTDLPLEKIDWDLLASYDDEGYPYQDYELEEAIDEYWEDEF